MTRRAVITGIGVVAPTGIGTEPYWEATQRATNGIQRISRFDPTSYKTQLAGEVRDFQPTEYIDQRLIVQTDRWTWMALAASQMALKDAAFEPASHDPYQMSVITSSSSGGNEFGQREIQSLWAKGPIFVGAYQSIAWFYAATTGQISIKYGMKGASGVIVNEGAGGLDALAQARRAIRRGGDLVISGGTEGPIGPYALVCQLQSGCLSSEQDPTRAYQPFDARASGFVPGEGGAILIVEDLDFAKQRGAPHIYAEIIGHGASQDASNYAGFAADGQQFGRAIGLALKDAEVSPQDIDLVFADAVGTQTGDAAEVKAMKQVFGSRAADVPVTAPKSMVGRLYGGGASLDVATALLAMRDGQIPPTINLEMPAPECDLNIVNSTGRAADINTVLVNARGYGGFNSALVLRKYVE